MSAPKPFSLAPWSPTHRNAKAIAAVGLAVALGFLAQWYLVHRAELWAGLVCWAAALASLSVGFWQVRGMLFDGGRSEDEAPRRGETAFSGRSELLLFVAVAAVGIFFRLYKLGDIPLGLNHDAAFHGLYAIRINQGIRYAPVVACCGQNANETTLAYIIAGFQHLVGNTALAIELATALAGCLTLGAFYLLVRRMFDARVALVSTFLLAVSGWHITFSRAGWHAILVPLFEALTFYFLLRALQTRRMRDFLIAGFVLGLSQYTYDAGHAVPIVAAVFLGYLMVRERGFLRTRLSSLAAYAVGAIASLAPLAWWALTNWDMYVGRSRSLWVGHQIKEANSWEPLWRNIGDGLLIFNFRARGNDFFVGEPLLDLPVSVFFVLGLAYSLTRLRRPEHVLLLAILALSLTNGILSEPNGNRAIGAVLPVVAYAGLFLVVAWRWLQRTFTGLAAYWSLWLVILLGGTGFLTFREYLGPDHRSQWGYYPEAASVGKYVKSIADRYDVHLVAGATTLGWPANTVTYLSFGGHGDPFQCRYTSTKNAEDILSIPYGGPDGCPGGPSRPASPERGAAYIVEIDPKYEAAFQTLRAAYPTASLDHVYALDGSAAVVADVLLVPPGAHVLSSTPFEGGRDPLQGETASGTAAPSPSQLVDVHADGKIGYDEIAFAFDGAPASYRIAYTTAPAQCGTGQPIPLAGQQAALQVTFTPAAAHDEQGSQTFGQLFIASNLRAISEAVQTCDNDGVLTWVLVLNQPADFRVADQAPASGQGGLVIEIAQP